MLCLFKSVLLFYFLYLTHSINLIFYIHLFDKYPCIKWTNKISWSIKLNNRATLANWLYIAYLRSRNCVFLNIYIEKYSVHSCFQIKGAHTIYFCCVIQILHIFSIFSDIEDTVYFCIRKDKQVLQVWRQCKIVKATFQR